MNKDQTYYNHYLETVEKDPRIDDLTDEQLKEINSKDISDLKTEDTLLYNYNEVLRMSQEKAKELEEDTDGN